MNTPIEYPTASKDSETPKDPNWPAWFYGPDDQSAIFQKDDEIPEGWKDHPSKVGNADEEKKGDDDNSDSEIEMSREEIIAGLKEFDAEFKPNARTKTLYAQLQALLAD